MFLLTMEFDAFMYIVFDMCFDHEFLRYILIPL
jgi:hypothetical protein